MHAFNSFCSGLFHKTSYSSLSLVDENSDEDVANEVGNMGLDLPDPSDCFNERIQQASRRKRWKLNYQEASIYLEEGQNNDKFNTHPQSHEALPAYEVAHNRWFYSLDLLAAIFVMLLAACERPAVPYMQLPVGVHGSLELLCLLILSLDLGIRVKWLGWRTYIGHRRTLVKTLMVLLMLTESIVVLVRQENHFRVTRALRPFFLMHTHYCKGVRSYPDVMMPSYHKSRFYALFFIVYLSLELYFLMNLLLAVVYDSFSNLEKSKVKSLFFHKHEGCMHAFRLLVTQENRHQMNVKHFIGMMEYFQPNRTRREYYLMFKSLNSSKSGTLSNEEFFRVYDVVRLKWKLKSEADLWSSDFPQPFRSLFKGLHCFATWKYFDYFIYTVIAGNFLWILIETISISTSSTMMKKYNFASSWISITFVCIYCVEAVIKMLGRGPKDYFTSGWDVFDFLVTAVSVVGVFGEIFENSFYYVIVLRPFRLLRLFKVKRRYRDVLGTLFLLFSKLISLSICIITVYYFFAIIGMELFLNVKLKNCCVNTSVESYYRDSDSGNTGFYYLNNFDNIFISGVTLFELTVVNNWYIIMEGYAHAYSEWVRVYFMLFYIVMMVVMNIVVAFVLESFMFRINYRRQMHLDTIDDDGVYKEEVALSENEMHMVNVLSCPLTGDFIAAGETGQYVFKGESQRSREDFSLRMYRDEVEEWGKQLREARQDTINSIELRRFRQRPNAGTSLEDISSIGRGSVISSTSRQACPSSPAPFCNSSLMPGGLSVRADPIMLQSPSSDSSRSEVLGSDGDQGSGQASDVSYS
ncbi:two pore calcium channel protein 1-like [Elysia marginata]|uniref:Two pore calcium channel protein 1-like n=1 Tax=Elysia marginata TaxID=1093978 RepID=A0AAV4JHS5_9GAST|nr:two pore calcium channel protein 1-like [Elysia marginata]